MHYLDGEIVMSIDTTRIDEQIRRLQEAKRIAADPELMAILRSLPAKDTSSPRPQSAKRRMTVPMRKGTLIRAVAKIVAGYDRRFTSADVIKTMQSEGFRFVGDPLVAVNGALRKLTSKGQVRVARQGSGRTPHDYERVPQPGATPTNTLAKGTHSALSNGSGKRGRKYEVAEFIRENGPSKRVDIVTGAKLPPGTVAQCLNDKERFRLLPGGRWDLVSHAN
jgi:hypothetical protein